MSAAPAHAASASSVPLGHYSGTYIIGKSPYITGADISSLYISCSMGPPETTIVGIFTLQAPITSDGVVLSQPHSNTTPSTGLARMDSSTSMLTRLRYSMAVGLISVSPSDITGNSTGNPPASRMPRFTDSASSLKCALQGVSSDQVLQIPITGLPLNSYDRNSLVLHPGTIDKSIFSFFPNQFWLRNCFSILYKCIDKLPVKMS